MWSATALTASALCSMCCDTGNDGHGMGFGPSMPFFVYRKEDYYGYFSEMSLNMQEGRKPSAAALTGENAFEEEESFDELPVPPVIRSSVQPLNQAAPPAWF